MKRKLMVSLILAIMLMVSVTPVFAAVQPRVFIDNTQVVFDDIQPTIINGRTMVPLGSILNKLGLKYQWYGEKQIVFVLDQNNTCYELTLNSTTVESYKVINNGSNDMRSMVQLLGPHDYIFLDVAPIAIEGRTMVPIRLISALAGYDTTWDGISGSVIVHTDPSYYNPAPQYNTPNDNIATDKDGIQLAVDDIVYDFASLKGTSYIVYAKVIYIGTDNYIFLQWFDITEPRWLDNEIPYLSYFRANPSEFSLLQRSSGITFDTPQWYKANEVYLDY